MPSTGVDQAHPAGQTGASADPDAGGRARGSVGRAAAIAALVVAVQAVLVALFAWPAVETAPRDVPVVVAAPPPAAAALTQQLQGARPGAFTVTTVADQAAADAALRDRQAYAAFILRPDGPRLHVVSAASPTVAQLLTQQAQALGAAGGGEPIPVVDVVATDADDPRGAGFLPLVLTSMAAGILLAAAVGSRRARLAGIGVFAVLAGLIGAAVLQYGLDALPGAYLANAAVIGLLALAVSGAVAGLGALLGPAGVGLAVLLVFVLGNPCRRRRRTRAAASALGTARPAAAAGGGRHAAAGHGLLRRRRRHRRCLDTDRLGGRRPHPPTGRPPAVRHALSTELKTGGENPRVTRPRIG